MMRIAINLIVFIAVVFDWGCKDGDRGTVRGAVTAAKCGLDDHDFDLEVDYFSSTYFENTLSVRLQHTTDVQGFSDGLYFEVRDVAAVAERLGESIPIQPVPSLSEFKESGPTESSGDENGYPSTPYAALVRATLYLNETCTDNPPGFGDGEGTVTFTRIYQPGKSSRIRGSFDLEFIDPRTWESTDVMDSASVTGDFDFTYSERHPEQPFD